jgi:urease accessory protein
MFVDTSRSEPALSSDAGMQRALGAARVALDGTRLADLYQKSPCKVLMPRVDGRDRAEVVFINSSGGIAGGDMLDYAVAVSGPGVTTVTTQASEKVYGAIDRDARLSMSIRAGEGASLEWLPQQTIAFDGARLRRRTRLDLAASARVLALDWLVMGRQARGETMTRGVLRDDWRVSVDGRLVWADALRLTGNLDMLPRRRAALGGNRAFATLVYAAPDAADRLDGARVLIEPCGEAGVTVVNGVLVARFLAPGGMALAAQVGLFLEGFRAELDGFAPWPPRLWTC